MGVRGRMRPAAVAALICMVQRGATLIKPSHTTSQLPSSVWMRQSPPQPSSPGAHLLRQVVVCVDAQRGGGAHFLGVVRALRQALGLARQHVALRVHFNADDVGHGFALGQGVGGGAAGGVWCGDCRAGQS